MAGGVGIAFAYREVGIMRLCRRSSCPALAAGDAAAGSAWHRRVPLANRRAFIYLMVAKPS